MTETDQNTTNALTPMAERIESRMKSLGIENRYQLAKKSGIARAVFTNIYRREDKKLWADVALKLADTLKCRVEWLITGSGPMTDDVVGDYERLYADSPVMKLSELGGKNLFGAVAAAIAEEGRQAYRCPIASSVNTVGIKTGRKLGRFDEEAVLFIDLERKEPTTGQIVLARPVAGGTPEFYTYSTSMGKSFLKAMTEDLPENLKFIEMDDDVEVVGCFVAAIII